jgi:amidophosphoribosyltransferase
MKIIVIGSSGLLGKKVYHLLSHNHEVGGFNFSHAIKGHKQLDITQRREVIKAFRNLSPDVIVHTSALCDTDFCETHKGAAHMVNVVGTQNIVKISKDKKAKLIYISSDYIFDGESGPYFEDSDPNPINYYGHTKLEGERIIIEELNNYAIIRPTILYGYNDESDKPTFPSNILKKLKERQTVEVDGYIKKYPLLIDDLSIFIKKIIEEDRGGIFHIKGGERVTRYEWALDVVNIFNIDGTLIKETASDNFAKKPRDVNLETRHRDLYNFQTVPASTGLRVCKMQRGCTFKLFYSARPETSVLGQSVSQFRIKAGQLLASEHPVDADIVVPIPESGLFPATGYAQTINKPLMFGVVRDYFTKRTLFTDSLKSRVSMIENKLIPIPDIITGKKIVLIDEAILSGITLKVVSHKLREFGATEIHIRIPSPKIVHKCFARMHPETVELIYSEYEKKGEKKEFEQYLAGYFDADSVAFLSLYKIRNAIDTRIKDRCFYCFGKEMP